MAKNEPKAPADIIVPLNMNGLRGRMLHLPAPPKKKRHILLIYGHHASLERMVGLAEELNRYGDITMPDLPGFGGMESFYKLGEKPTLDNLADYLAAFVKLRYNRKRVTIMAMSFGFTVVTRMLQRNPELVKKVDLLISVVGFAHHEDFRLKSTDRFLLRYTASLLSNRIPAMVMRHVALRPFFIRTVYKLTSHKNAKFHGTKAEEWEKQVNFEINLWQINDVRTQGDTAVTMFTMDLCNVRLNMPVYHISIKNDRYFDNHLVEQHLGVIFDKVHVVEADTHGHAPTVVATAKQAAPFIPTKIRRVLARS